MLNKKWRGYNTLLFNVSVLQSSKIENKPFLDHYGPPITEGTSRGGGVRGLQQNKKMAGYNTTLFRC
jgi:hypothetical protein